MKRKARIQTGIDDRLVAIYARKSRITNKGDSIGVQFKQSADYAINQLSLPEDYEFARYEDKGLSGYYSDRPDFQRLLRDIEMGKIKAVACYKLDRISRKTSDLMRLLEYFERHDVTLLVCSNNINTRISTSKIIIQVLAIIAEFERDILTERIQDNLMELAKDGRWLGGKTPTGFSSQRVTTGSGKNKSAISFLVPVQEEKEIVLEIYGTFWETRSLLQTANIINEKYETKHGAKFTTSTIRLILRNPIYCVADEYSYNYFLEHDGNLFGEPSDFDGQHGLTAYNKTDQMKVEDEDSTFFNPKFSQLLTRKPISEWIVSVGRHEGFISSRKWVETQNMLDEIAEKYNRPHRKTNALLSGLMYCPICGKRLRVLPESNRWTNGKPRFKYACPGVRAKECTFKGVEGVTLDEFVIHSLSSLQEEHSDYYRQLLENRVASMIRTDQSEKEYQETKKAIERLNADIAAQVRNLREADDALKRFIQDDIKELTDELAKREAALRRMEDTQSENQYLIHELNGMKKRLLSFEEFAKGAQPEALFTLVHSIVDRIYITTDGTKQKCQVYIKGCATEDYSDVLGAAGYIEEEPLLPVASYVPPMCDLDYYSIDYTCFFDASVKAKLSIILQAENHVLGLPDGKARFVKEVSLLGQAYALSKPSDEAMKNTEEIAFFQAVKARLCKFEGDRHEGKDQYDSVIKSIVSTAISSDEVVDIFDAAGIDKPDISILSDEFLQEVKSMQYKNVALELLKKLLNDEVKVRTKRNIAQSKTLMEMLDGAINKYQNNLLTTAEVIDELIKIAQDLKKADMRSLEMGLSSDELAFYDALSLNDSATEVLGDEQLRIIAREVADKVRKNATIDWAVKESVRARLMVIVRRILKKYGYPPDKQEQAIQLVMTQAANLADDWAQE